jgi:hypothetical protein
LELKNIRATEISIGRQILLSIFRRLGNAQEVSAYNPRNQPRQARELNEHRQPTTPPLGRDRAEGEEMSSIGSQKRYVAELSTLEAGEQRSIDT